MARPRAAGLLLALCASLALALGAAPARAEFGYLGPIGSAGAGAGQFYDPYGLAGDAAGNLYIADTGNFRIQKLRPDGTPFDPPIAWGAAGTGNSQFSKPYDVAVDGLGNVYVADSWRGGPETPNERVQKFDANGGFVKKWGSSGPGDGQFQGLSGIAAHTDTSVNPPRTYVYTAEPGRVQKFDVDGAFLAKWGTGGFGPGQFRDLWDVTTDAAGNVYTVESDGGGPGGNHRVQKFDKDGNFLAQFDVQSTGECYRRLGVDTGGFVYVTPECAGGGGKLKRFSPAGALVSTQVCQNSGGFVSADRSGKVYLGGQNNGLLVFGEGGGSCSPPPPTGGDGGAGGGGGTGGLTFNGNEGVTIDGGARFTNDPDVTLTVAPPQGATEVRASNDGGFIAPSRLPIAANGRYAWTLDRDPLKSERLPKTVYVRFSGPAGASALSFTDDIILDQTPPTIGEAMLSGGGSASAAAARARRFTLRVRAKDNASGVGQLQLATNRRKPAKPRKFRSKLTIEARRPPAFVRVRDRAGNYSKWRRVKR